VCSSDLAGVTSLGPGEVIRSFDVPASALAATYAFGRISLTTYGRSAALVIASSGSLRGGPIVEGGTAVGHEAPQLSHKPLESQWVRAVVTGSTPAPVLLEVSAGADRAEIDAAVDAITQWHEDAHGPADWRAAQTRRLVHETVGALRGEEAG
jgi:hypothetical protein